MKCLSFCTLFTMLLLFLSVSVCFSSSQTKEDNINNVIKHLASNDPAERIKAIDAFKSYSIEMENQLETIFLVNKDSKDPDKLDKARIAILLLGEFHTDKVIKFLVKYIYFTPVDWSKIVSNKAGNMPNDLSVSFPCEAALINIGIPAIDSLLDSLASGENKDDATIYTIFVDDFKVFKDPAQIISEYIINYYNKQRDDRKARLRHAFGDIITFPDTK